MHNALARFVLRRAAGVRTDNRGHGGRFFRGAACLFTVAFLIVVRSAAAQTPQTSSTPPTPPTPPASPAPPISPAAPEPAEIIIGHFGSLTGSEATFGQTQARGVELAVLEQNAAGGLRGKPIRLINYDTEGKQQVTGTVVTRLITQDKAVAIIGEASSSLSIVAAGIAQQYAVPMISPSSTNVRVTQIGDMIFRACFLDSFQGEVVARFARTGGRLHAARVAILYDQSGAYSRGLRDSFRDAFTRMGGAVVAEEAYTGGDQDFSAQLTTIRDAKPDAIFVPGYYTDAATIAVQARRLGITVPLLGGDGWDSARLAEIAGPAIEGCFYSNHYTPDQPVDRVRSFVERYTAHFSETPESGSALAYDAARLAFDAIGRARSVSGPDVAAALAATRGYHGVTGVIDIDANRNPRKSAVMVEMKGGLPTFVAEITPDDVAPAPVPAGVPASSSRPPGAPR